jgi:serine/threonine-protein kinase HipA
MDPLKTAYVKIWGEVVGAVTWRQDRGYAVFEYEPAFLGKGWDLSPVHLGTSNTQPGEIFSFPNLDPFTFLGLPGLLASSLPDDFGNSIIDSWLTRNGRDPRSFNPVERLCYIGTRGMGALEYSPQLSSRKLNKSAPIEIQKLMELAQDILAERSKLDVHMRGQDKEKAEAMLDILRVGVSAGGAVPKAIIAIDNEGHIISGQTTVPDGYEHWILKFDGVLNKTADAIGKPREECRVEYAHSLMAKSAGINMMECRLLEENGRAHFMTRRFDRQHNDKIHVLSLAGMGHLGWNPAGRVGYEDAFNIMRHLKLPYLAHEQQFRRMVFNALIRNVDDHVKNISYTMDKDGVWTLSPAYDITFSYNLDDMLGDRHKMTINGKQNDLTNNDFLDVAHNMEINKPEEIIKEILEVVGRWPDFAKQAGVKPEVSKYVGSLQLDHNRLESGLSMR